MAVWLLFKGNAYQHSLALNASNYLVGRVYSYTHEVEKYLTLGKVNDDLATENARLRNLLPDNYHNELTKPLSNSYTLESRDDPEAYKVVRYSYVKAKVVNNTLAFKKNFLVLDKGFKDGIEPGMGVIDGRSIVGITKDVTEHFCTVMSILNTDSKISVELSNTNHKGSLIWTGNSPTQATVIDIPTHVKVKTGDWIITSSYSLFPEGLKVGYAYDAHVSEHLLNIDVVLLTDMARLEYVYVIVDKFAEEKKYLDQLIDSHEDSAK